MTDNAAEEAARLLPCDWGGGDPEGCSGGEHNEACTASFRPAVAAALRERDERIEELEAWGTSSAAQCATGLERIAALEAERLLPCCKVDFCDLENTGRHHFGCPATKRPAIAAVLRERDEKIARLRVENESLKTAEAAAAQLAADAIRRIAALEAENERLRAFVKQVGLLGILDHERNGVLQCESCCDDARRLRAALAGRK